MAPESPLRRRFSPECFSPDWPAPPTVRALQTTRRGGVSLPPYDSFNLGGHVGDAPEAVAANRAALARPLPAMPCWLTQTHGIIVADAASAPPGVVADAAFTRQPGKICVVMTADCLPVLFCDRQGSVVAAAHAGWRGLAAGILERSLDALGVPAGEILAWLGPAIGPAAFEVGDEVRQAFVEKDGETARAFLPCGPGYWRADLFQLARRRLALAGVDAVYGGKTCSFSEPERYFSYRRDGVTGRQASCIWLT